MKAYQYQLYINKEEHVLEIKLLQAMFSDKINTITDKPRQYNNNYCFGSNRKALKELAIKIKQQWVTEAQDRLDMILAIKI